MCKYKYAYNFQTHKLELHRTHLAKRTMTVMFIINWLCRCLLIWIYSSLINFIHIQDFFFKRSTEHMDQHISTLASVLIQISIELFQVERLYLYFNVYLYILFKLLQTQCIL